MARMKAPEGVFDDMPEHDYTLEHDDEDVKDGGADEESELPPDFRAHTMVALDPDADPNERVQALYDAIEACAGGDHGKGLDVIIGLGKAKHR